MHFETNSVSNQSDHIRQDPFVWMSMFISTLGTEAVTVSVAAATMKVSHRSNIFWSALNSIHYKLLPASLHSSTFHLNMQACNKYCGITCDNIRG